MGGWVGGGHTPKSFGSVRARSKYLPHIRKATSHAKSLYGLAPWFSGRMFLGFERGLGCEKISVC